MSTAIKSAGQTLLANSRKAVKASGEVWQSTGLLFIDNKEQVMGVEQKASVIRNTILDAFTKDVDGDIPKKGENAKGEEIVLRHDGSKKGQPEGQIKFSAWQETRRTAQGISTICKAVANTDFDTIFPNGILIGKTKCEELAKGDDAAGGAYKAIKRSLALIATKTTELSDVTEIAEIDGLFAKTMMDYTNHTNSVKVGAAPKAASA